MRNIICAMFLLFIAAHLPAGDKIKAANLQKKEPKNTDAAREIIPLEKGWRFVNREIPGAEQIFFEDNDWEQVTVPHDWAIGKPFDLNQDMQWVTVKEDGETVPQLRTGRTGALPISGIGWYRKQLDVRPTDSEKRIFVEFDGAMSLAKIYVNGKFAGEWPYGYSSFSFDITDKINFNGKNILAVRLENKPESSRWYSGAGIYRNVRLVKTNPVHVTHWGTYITTPEISAKKALVNVRTELSIPKNILIQTKNITWVTQLIKGTSVVATSKTSFKAKDTKNIIEQKIKLPDPELWSPKNAALYTAVSYIYVENELVDKIQTTFGVRSLYFDKDKGLLLNGNVCKIKGVCMHHDLGALGAAINERALQRQLEMLKEMGCNAIRTSHNPPAPELLDLTDKMGFLVQVEAFDEWRTGKNENGYHTLFDQWAEKDLRAMVRRDRNHPSVIMWSIGNEVREQGENNGGETAKFLADICREEDPTRPVTAGFDHHTGAFKNGLANAVDLIGFNYKPWDYAAKHKEYPNRIIYGSETASTVSSRGDYKFPAEERKGAWYWDYQMSSYDMEYPDWASTPDKEFQAQDENAFVLGEFVWTGFDYLGEPTPYNDGTPARSSYFGIIDLAGLKKDRFYLYQSRWSDKPVLHLLPHWNWPEREGKCVPVFCYSNYPQVELFVNGVSQGIKKLEKNSENIYKRYRLMWPDVIYQPGEIKVIAYNDAGKAVAEQTVKTAGAPYSIQLTADRTSITSNSKDLCFITVKIVDKDGNICPKANNLLFFNVSENGVLKALCNGDPTDQTMFSSNYMRVFDGQMVAIIANKEEQNGNIVLSVSGLGLKNTDITLIIN